MTKTKTWHFSAIIIAILITFFAGGLTGDPALARKDDSEPGVTDSFGRSNYRVKSGNIDVKAVNAALLRKFNPAFAAANKSKNALTQKTVEWLYLRKEPYKAGHSRIMAFVQANPTWPRIENLRALAERTLLANKASAQLLNQHFIAHRPSSPAGYAAKAKLELSRGNKAAARKSLLRAWYNPKLGGKTKSLILAQMRGLLSKSNHERRLWILIHAKKGKEAISTAGLISSSHVKAAKAAHALIRREKNALGLYKKIPSSLRGKLAIKFVLARYYRKTKRPITALKILKSVSVKTSGVYDQASWSVERRLIVRQLAGREHQQHWPSIYNQAKKHGASKGRHFSEGEFLAGWMAFRKLGNTKTALNHFKRMASGAEGRTEKSRANYWIARTHLALGNKKEADVHFRLASRPATLFYAQLAREALGLGRTPIPLSSTKANRATKTQVERMELVRAVRLLHRSGGAREVGAFIWPVARTVKTKAQASAAAEVLQESGGPHLAVRFAKAAGSLGLDIDNWGYPLRAMPKIKQISRPVETPMVFGISRQESEFNAVAKSHAGARGLMQLMPATARWMAKKYNLRHSTAKLTQQPAYNAMMGTALLGDLVHRFNGSYILTFVGYNAGPTWAKRWIKRYGDPRDANTDPVDWIESIPFRETRKYVQKVMQNIHIYRSRLTPRSLTGMRVDLARGTISPVSATGANTGANTGAKKAKQTCGGRKTILALIQDC